MADRADNGLLTKPVPLLLPRPVPPRISDLLPPPVPVPASQQTDPSGASRGTEPRNLIVGSEVLLSGEISSCDRLVIEGNVEADLHDCHDVDIAETGLFKGAATIDNAEVRGRFEGELVVRKRLLIRATGRVSGKIAYGEAKVATPQAETETHRAALAEFRKQVGERHPQLGVQTGLMALEGKMEMFS